MAPDPAGVCCDCAGKTTPCDSCTSCTFYIPTDIDSSPAYSDLATAQAALANEVASCIAILGEMDLAGVLLFTAALSAGILTTHVNFTPTGSETLTVIYFDKIAVTQTTDIKIDFDIELFPVGSLVNFTTIQVILQGTLGSYSFGASTVGSSFTGSHTFTGVVPDNYRVGFDGGNLSPGQAGGLITTSLVMTDLHGAIVPCLIVANYYDGLIIKTLACS